MDTFMSLNRDPVVPEIVLSHREDSNAEGFEGARTSGWTVAYPGVLVGVPDRAYGLVWGPPPFERLGIEDRKVGERGSRIPL